MRPLCQLQTSEPFPAGSDKRVSACKTFGHMLQRITCISSWCTIFRKVFLRAEANCQTWGVCTHLSVDDGPVVYGCQLAIPHRMRRQVLTQLHESQQGLVRTKQRAGLTVYWPGMDSDIDDVILACTLCQRHLSSHSPEPIISKPHPCRPFQEIAVDFCTYAGRDFLIVVDCFTDWPDVVYMGTNTTTPRVVTALKQAFVGLVHPMLCGRIRVPNLPQNYSRTLLEISPHHVLPHIPTEQWEGRGYHLVNEEVN